MGFAGGASGVLAALTEPDLRLLPPDRDASSSNDGGTDASVSVDTEEGLPPPKWRALAEAAAAGGAVIVTIVLAALFTADVEL